MKFSHRQGGKCHRTLAYLMKGPADHADISEVVGLTKRERRKFWWLLTQLCAEGLIRKHPHRGRYAITEDGETYLERLDSGGTPNVRIFLPEKAA